MIETQEAFDDVERIAQVTEVDGLFIGPGDLSRARGRGPNRDTPADFEDHRRIAAAARGARKPWGLSAESIPRQRFALETQADFMTVADDMSLLRAGLAAVLAACPRP
jgi:2-keto-3-deoxy-L-rhamnonate aldolase RhmA